MGPPFRACSSCVLIVLRDFDEACKGAHYARGIAREIEPTRQRSPKIRSVAVQPLHFWTTSPGSTVDIHGEEDTRQGVGDR
jgi:hypothetical protein